MAALEESKNERQPLNKKNIIHYVDIGKNTNSDDTVDMDVLLTDPLVTQLPKAMHKYVKTPKEHQAKVTFVNRGLLYSIFHQLMSIFCCLCCFYSCCRMTVVRKGEVALTQYGDEPEILGQGRHVLLSPWNKLLAIKRLTDPIIKHGPIHILKVQSGQLGYGIDMKTGHPILLTQGEHIIDSAHFQWVKFITLRERVTNLANLTIIRVETGYVGYCYKQGQLVILKPGLHLIQPPDRFGDIVTTQMTILDLPLATHETSDYVPLAIKAAVFYRIIDPLKALVRIQDISKQIQETSTATLAGIIRGSSLADVASRSTPFYHQKDNRDIKRIYMKNKKEEKQDQDVSYDNEENKMAKDMSYKSIPIAPYAPQTPSAPPYFQHVHDEFMQQLHDHVRDEWGIEIQNIRIESLKIADARLQSNISSQAIQVSNTHNKFMLLMKQQEIITVQAETDAKKIKIDTEAAAQKITTEARAKAEAVVIAAEANKKAKELQGQGESEYSRLLESTKLGTQLAAMKLQAEAIRGLKSIAYVPHLPGLLSKSGVFADGKMLMPERKDQE